MTQNDNFPSAVTKNELLQDLRTLGVSTGDGVFVHASMRQIGNVIGNARTVVSALLETLGRGGLLAMPGFSTDAYFPNWLDKGTMSAQQIADVEAAVPGFSPDLSNCKDMGAIAECFRTWPGTCRSPHPAVSVCLNGEEAQAMSHPHDAAWATGPDSPFGAFMRRPNMKILLIGVGWNRCTALHLAETLAPRKRLKTRRFKAADGTWQETPEVADDLGRLFPDCGAAFENTGAVHIGKIGHSEARLCDYAALVQFATDWIDAANLASGDRT